MRKKGFTLMEILMAMGLVGIIAALTIPRTVSNVNERVIVPAQERAANVLEQGFADIIYGPDSNMNMTGTSTTLDAVINPWDCDNLISLKNRALLGIFDAPDSAAYITAVGNTFNGYRVYSFRKFDAYLTVNPTLHNPDPADEHDWVADLYIDGNGNKAPNTVGRDIAHYRLLNDGHLERQ